MKMEEMQKLAWDVWEVYKGWGNWVYKHSRPYYQLYVTLPNTLMVLVTAAAVLAGFVYLLKERSKKKKAAMLYEEDYRDPSEVIKARFVEGRKPAKKVEEKEAKSKKKDGQNSKVGQPINCPFKHLFGGMMDADDGHSATPQDQETMAMLREQIHKNINLEKGDGKASGGKGKSVDVSDPDDESDVDEDSDVEEVPRFDKDGRDPFEMAMHIPGELKKIKNKITTREMEKQLTEDQRKEEALARRQQLEQIFKLMQDQKEKFGTQNTDDIEEQMKMYSL